MKFRLINDFLILVDGGESASEITKITIESSYATEATLATVSRGTLPSEDNWAGNGLTLGTSLSFTVEKGEFPADDVYTIVLLKDETTEVARGDFLVKNGITVPLFGYTINEHAIEKLWETLVYLEEKLAENDAALKTLTEGYVTE